MDVFGFSRILGTSLWTLDPQVSEVGKKFTEEEELADLRKHVKATTTWEERAVLRRWGAKAQLAVGPAEAKAKAVLAVIVWIVAPEIAVGSVIVGGIGRLLGLW